MEDKLRSLTEKLYKDGLKKGQIEADELITKAKKQAEKIIEEAHAKAKIIVANAEKEASDKRRKIDSELVMSSKQVINKIKHEIVNLLSISNIKEPVSETFKNETFIQELILRVVETWDKTSPTALDARIELPESMKEKLQHFIHHSCGAYLQKGLELHFDEKIQAGFKVMPKDSSFAIEFTEESFLAFFNSYLKPATRDLLFGQASSGE